MLALLLACPSPECPDGERFEHGACVGGPAPQTGDSGAPVATGDTGRAATTGDTGAPPTWGSTPWTGPSMLRGEPSGSGRFPGPAPAGELALEVPIGAACAVPALGDGVAVIGVGFDLGAIELQTGTPRWTFRADGVVQSAAAIVDGTVYAADRLGVAYAVDLANGTERWRAPGPAACGHPVVDAGEVWVVCGALRVLDAGGGAVLRERPVADPDPTQGVTLSGALAIVGGGPLQGFERASLDEAWAADLGVTHSTAATDGVSAWFETVDGVYAIGTSQGAVVWAADAFTSLESTSPALADGVVYTATTRAVRARDAATGDERWSAQLDARPIGGIALAGDGVFVTDEDGAVTALARADGARRWRLPLEACSGPSLAEGQLVVGTRTGLAVVR